MKLSDDRFLALWGLFVAGGACSAAVLVVTGLPAAAAWPWLLGSGLVHVVYVLSLARAYDVADFSLAYPVARGGGALVAAVLGASVLHDGLSLLAWTGIAIVGAGLTVIVRPGTRGVPIGWAIVVACCIGVYTTIDAAGAREIDGAAYLVSTYIASAVTVTVWGIGSGRANQLRLTLRSAWPTYLWCGAASAAAYGLVLAAVRLAPLGYVAVLREASVLLAAIVGITALREPSGARRVGAAAVVTGGLVVLVVGRA